MPASAIDYPAVGRYGDFDMESFESYYARWPRELAGIPKGIVEDWVYRHWSCFRERWVPLRPHRWSYQQRMFTTAEILSIDHVLNWIAELDVEGLEFVAGAPRANSRVGRFMLSQGTFPAPIIVAEHAGHVVCPQSRGLPMKTPLQLIEGHTRLACLRGMIHANHAALRAEHPVWLVRIPHDAMPAI